MTCGGLLLLLLLTKISKPRASLTARRKKGTAKEVSVAMAFLIFCFNLFTVAICYRWKEGLCRCESRERGVYGSMELPFKAGCKEGMRKHHHPAVSSQR